MKTLVEVDGVLAGDDLILAALALLHHGCCRLGLEHRCCCCCCCEFAVAGKSSAVVGLPPSRCETTPAPSILFTFRKILAVYFFIQSVFDLRGVRLLEIGVIIRLCFWVIHVDPRTVDLPHSRRSWPSIN